MTAKCSGRSSRTGEPCQAYPVRGAAVCVAHGGRAPQVKAKAKQRRTEQAARAELARLQLPPVDDPLTALASVTAEVLAWKDNLAAKVNELTSLRYSTEGGEQLRAEVALWERALDRCERFLTAMARLNIDERLAAIAEAQAQAIMDALRIGFEAAGVDAGQRRVALAAVKDHLAA
jgi:hypothetical protein